MVPPRRIDYERDQERSCEDRPDVKSNNELTSRVRGELTNGCFRSNKNSCGNVNLKGCNTRCISQKNPSWSLQRHRWRKERGTRFGDVVTRPRTPWVRLCHRGNRVLLLGRNTRLTTRLVIENEKTRTERTFLRDGVLVRLRSHCVRGHKSRTVPAPPQRRDTNPRSKCFTRGLNSRSEQVSSRKRRTSTSHTLYDRRREGRSISSGVDSRPLSPSGTRAEVDESHWKGSTTRSSSSLLQKTPCLQ